jgi:cyanophycinase
MRCLVVLFALLAAGTPYRYFLTGSATDVSPKPTAAFALIGGGKDVDDINRWFANKAAGGDLLVLRAAGDDAYNPYFFKLVTLNSAQTLVIPSAEAASDKFVVAQIAHAEAIFLAGGDQWNYVRLWNHSPVGDALRAAIQRGIPLGGTSAGLAVLGQYQFSAEKDTVASQRALLDPYDEHVTLANDFLNIAALKNTITDSHFKARDRMGRTLVFLARMLADFHLPEARAIAIDERTAALIQPNGQMHVAGLGHVYFLRARKPAAVCRKGIPLSMSGIEVYRTGEGAQFDTGAWRGSGGQQYSLTVSEGVVTSDQPNHSIY